MEFLILIGAVQSVFFAALVLSKKGKSVSDKILAFWLFIFAAHLSFVYYSFLEGHIFYIEYGYIPSGVVVAYYSLMYVYAKSLTSKENVFKAKWLLHIIPTVILYLCLIPFIRLPYEGKVELVTNLTTDPFLAIVFGVIILSASFYMIATLRLLKKHKRSIRGMFSYEEKINLNWLKILTILLVLLWIVISSLVAYVYYLDATTAVILPEDHMMLDVQGQSAFVIFVLVLGFFGIKQQVIYSAPIKIKEIQLEKTITSPVNDKYKKSGLQEKESEDHLQKLLNYMKVEKPYLDGKLSLAQIAIELGISTNYLSQVINENLDKNFFDFVNLYRVEEVKRLLVDPESKKFTLLTIAYDSGFNSKSSFNAIFKKFTGMTPTQHQKILQG